MTILTPLWMQNGTYPARFDRQLIKRTFGDREIVFDGLVIAPTSPTPNGNVSISVGSCTVQGDDQTDQGMYLVVNDAAIAQTMPAVPGSTKRIDLISLAINDPQAGGRTGNNATIIVTQGTVSGTPVQPTAPVSSISLAAVLRTAGDTAITAGMITDLAGRGLWPYTVATAAAPAKLPPNYLYVRVA